MKTAVIMERELNGVKVRQNHKTGFFNANDLLNLHNSRSGTQKRLVDYLSNKQTEEYEKAVIKDILQNNADSSYLDSGLMKANNEEPEKLRDLVCQVKRGKNGGTWLHPLVFIDFAMWLSVEFKLSCVKWLYDNLIKFRDGCGDGFLRVNEALFNSRPNTRPYTYIAEANMINKLVFGKTDAGQRNEATEGQLKMLSALQKLDIKLIEQGLDYYERYDELKRNKELIKTIL
jgi:hypothetical protein